MARTRERKVVTLDGVVHDDLPVRRDDHVLFLEQLIVVELREHALHFCAGAGEQIAHGRRVRVEVEVIEPTHFFYANGRDVVALRAEILDALAARRVAKIAVESVTPRVVSAAEHAFLHATPFFDQPVAAMLADIVERVNDAILAAGRDDALIEDIGHDKLARRAEFALVADHMPGRHENPVALRAEDRVVEEIARG